MIDEVIDLSEDEEAALEAAWDELEAEHAAVAKKAMRQAGDASRPVEQDQPWKSQ
jgi:hypothetical protein